MFFIKVLDLTISQGFINGFIFYANIVKANEHLLVPQAQVNPLTLFISWLNLDLGIETYFFNGLNAFTKTWLHLVFPLYVWTIAGLIIFSARRSGKIARVFGNNSVPVLATLFLVSYAKLLRMIVTALSFTTVKLAREQFGLQIVILSMCNTHTHGFFLLLLLFLCFCGCRILW